MTELTTMPSTPAGVLPLIGVTGRQGTGALMGAPRGFADAPVDLYLREYAQSVNLAGGIAVHIPLETNAIALVAHLDGLVIAGGEDVDPRRYGQTPAAQVTAVDPLRDQVELDLIAAAIAADVPILGICRGHQILNVALGGTLTQHLELGTGESHGSYAYPRDHRVHSVELTDGSVLRGVYGGDPVVNSFHHQAIDEPGDGVIVVGRAPDGVIEAIEVEGIRALGVQWHPETFASDPVFNWLIDAATAAVRTPFTEPTRTTLAKEAAA